MVILTIVELNAAFDTIDYGHAISGMCKRGYKVGLKGKYTQVAQLLQNVSDSQFPLVLNTCSSTHPLSELQYYRTTGYKFGLRYFNICFCFLN